MRYTVTYPLTLIVEAPDETEAYLAAERQLETLDTRRMLLAALSTDAEIEPAESPHDLDAPHILPEDFAV